MLQHGLPDCLLESRNNDTRKLLSCIDANVENSKRERVLKHRPLKQAVSDEECKTETIERSPPALEQQDSQQHTSSHVNLDNEQENQGNVNQQVQLSEQKGFSPVEISKGYQPPIVHPRGLISMPSPARAAMTPDRFAYRQAPHPQYESLFAVSPHTFLGMRKSRFESGLFAKSPGYLFGMSSFR